MVDLLLPSFDFQTPARVQEEEKKSRHQDDPHMAQRSMQEITEKLQHEALQTYKPRVEIFRNSVRL